YVALAPVVLARFGGPLGRRAEAAAAAGLDDHEVAARQTQADLAADVARARRARIERDAIGQPVASAVHTPRRHDAAIEHARERHLRSPPRPPRRRAGRNRRPPPARRRPAGPVRSACSSTRSGYSASTPSLGVFMTFDMYTRIALPPSRLAPAPSPPPWVS